METNYQIRHDLVYYSFCTRLNRLKRDKENVTTMILPKKEFKCKTDM